ncbi:hypothetical protein PR003_g23200 [Phytophthora rubi]|uniref:Retrovirus-related Pol polyprotein from transposon TNT 1-94-like beta-barrel domain-containing protein n=1 Tax=Phytophthora rubi TaxID=129364 RepID=A0A6A3IYJ7_9STRA|nr:hypothetical protein PR002_g23386 [Phytophthora rubi]KAE8985074.1 hypothetical protein PR001_g22996 [Phytophthora rubi]KAE9298582.1 hypothetical protein PR003_g23200 [Phytophthora rubi]
MSPSQASSDDFPRLIGAENFDVWKTRGSAALDGKHPLGYVQKPNYDGISEEESDESASDVSDSDDAPKPKSSESVEVDSDAVDYDEESEDEKPQSDSDEDSGDNSDTSAKRTKLPVVRPFNQSRARKERKRGAKEKLQPLNPRERRRQEAKTKAFLMKTMDNTHVRLVKNLTTSYEIFQFICQKYEGASFHGDPYFIQHYLMEIRYEEGSDLTEFFLKLENAMKAAQDATDTVMAESQKSIYLFHSMPKSWKNDLRIWKGRRKYIPYEDLKQSIEGKVRDMQAQERYTLAKGTPEASATKNERALVATGPSAPQDQDRNGNNSCSYCDRPRHNIRQCRGLQKDLRDGRVKAGTVLLANFAFKGNSKRDHPYRNSKNWNQTQGRNNSNNNGNGGNSRRDKNSGSRKNKNDGSGGKNRNSVQGQNRSLDSDSDDVDDDGAKRKVFHQQRRDTGLIAVATTINPPISLTAQANVQLDPTWTIDSGCTRHVTHESQWFADIATSGGSITVGGNNQIPIEGIGRVELAVIDSKGNSKTLTLHSVLYAPQLHFNLLSVPAAVKHGYRFNFDRKHCAMQTDQCFKLKALMATNTDLYQFQAQPKTTVTALMAKGAKPLMDSMMLRL